MALVYITNGKIVLPEEVVCGKSLAFDDESGKIVGLVECVPSDAKTIDADGKYVGEDASQTDVFGHSSLGGVCGILKNAVKSMGFKCKAIELNILQRCAAHCASKTDIEESFESGRQAVIHAVNGETDKMIAFKRISNNPYKIECVGLDLSKIANAEKTVPLEWITPDGAHLNENFTKYALPLIQGEPERRMENGLPSFAKLKMIKFKID